MVDFAPKSCFSLSESVSDIIMQLGYKQAILQPDGNVPIAQQPDGNVPIAQQPDDLCNEVFVVGETTPFFKISRFCLPLPGQRFPAITVFSYSDKRYAGKLAFVPINVGKQS